MADQSLHISRHIEAPLARVWDVVTNIAGAEETLTGVIRVEIISGSGYGIGTRWRETRKMFGKEHTEEMWVTAVDPLRSTTIEAKSAGTHYVTTFTLTPAGESTELAFTFEATLEQASTIQRVLYAAFGKVGMMVARKAVAQDLQDIAARAEADS